MKSSQHARRRKEEENVYKNSKCPCPANQGYARKSNRTPLGNIQDSANKNQYLAVEQQQKARSKSLSQAFSPATHSLNCRSIQTESTRIAPAAPFKQSLLPSAVTIRQSQNSGFQKTSSQKRPIRAVSSSCQACRCSESSVTNKKDKNRFSSDQKIDLCGSSDDDELPVPTAIKTSSSQKNIYVYRSSPQLLDSQTSKKISSGQLILNKLSADVQFVKLSSINQNSTSRRSQPPTPNNTKQTSKGSEDFAPNLLFPRQKSSCSSAKSPVKTEISLQNPTLRISESSVVSKNNRGCCSARSTTKTEQNPSEYATLPSQHFVTLSQDTLKTTIGYDSSELATMTSALNKVKVVRDSSIFSEEEKPFVDGQVFFQELEEGKCSTIKTIAVCSPLNINVPLRRSNSLSESRSNKRVKTTLKTSSIRKVVVYPLLYSPEYLEEIISYGYKQRKKFLIKTEWINAYMDRRYRTMTLNWLLQITGLIVSQFSPVYYMAVRIFDTFVIKLGLRKGNYQLAAIVAFWISLKYLDNTVLLKIPKIYSLCNGQYSKEQILSTERTMLKAISFCLNMSDPVDFLNYYLISSRLENNELLKYGSKFVLECATLFETYSMKDAPFIAASAIYLAYSIVLKSKVNINFIWFDGKDIQTYAECILLNNVQYVIMNKYEPLNRYLTPEKLKVAKEFFKTIF